MKKEMRLIKRLAALFLVLLLSIESFGAVVSDNDGSAFITKAEFDSLKNDFQSQIDQYNNSIDAKIDGAIAAYLAGIKTAKTDTVSSLSTGVYWSIGPFDRPRFQKGIPIYEVANERTYFNDSYNGSSSWKAFITWGDNFTNKVEITNGDYAYTDIIITNINTNGSVQCASLGGIYTNSAHFVQIWQLNVFQNRYRDTLATADNTNILPGKLSGVLRAGGTAHLLGGGHRPALEGQGNSLLDLAWATNYTNTIGRSYYTSVEKGKKISWDNKISCFGPLEYNCFTLDAKDLHEELAWNENIRDEILWDTVDQSIANDPAHCALLSDKNVLADRFYSPVDPTRRPWDTTPNATSYIRAGYNTINDSTGEYLKYYKDFVVDLNRGWFGQDDSSQNTYFKYNYYFTPDVGFRGITNWSHLGTAADKTVTNYLDRQSITGATFEDGNNNTLLSLAAGLPVVPIEKKQKVKILGEFRKDCSYSYVSNKNVLDEGTKDTTDVYVVYAKLTPFDITKMPEDESDLIDISPETKDTENVGKLAKCRIVRDGELNIEISNETNIDKVVFLKWEKLSNWSTIGTTRRTADGTNTDVRVRGSNTNTLSPPTWTYFGGGYLKLNDEFTRTELN